MSPEEESLRAAVVERPDEDEPRLVYADWLQQRGDPRGEFIAVQIARAKGDGRAELVQREAQLLTEHHGAWAAELGLEARQVVFERGFASSIGLVPLPQLLSLEGRIFRQAPVVRLAFDGLGPDDVAALVASSCLRGIKDLILDNNAIGSRGARLLAEAEVSSRLERLSLWSNDVGAAGATAIAESPHLGRVRQLELSYNAIGREGVRAVLASSVLSQLVRLGLASSSLGAGVRALADAGPRPTLDVLNLSENGISDDHVRALTRAPLLASLSTLFLARNPFGDKGVQRLVESAPFTRLAMLDLSYTLIGDVGVAAIAGSPRMTTLRRLRLAKLMPAEGSIGEAGALAIATSEHLAGLQELFLVGNKKVPRSAKRQIEARFGQGFVDRLFGA